MLDKKKEDFLRRSRGLAGAAVVVCGMAAAWSARAADEHATSASAEADALVAEALAHNPDLAAARQESEAAAARVKPAGALQDPWLTVNYENDGAAPSLGTEPMTRLQFMATQAFPFPGKLALAGKVANADARAVAVRPQRVALGLEGSVRRSYADLLEARENLRIVDEQIDTWRGIDETIRARYSAGMGSQQDVLRAQSERTRLLQQRSRDEAAEKTVLSALRRLLFRPLGAPIPTERRLLPTSSLAVPSSGEYLAKALTVTPELAEVALVKERAALSVDLAKRNLRPDFLASAGYAYRGGLPLMWSAGVGVSVPLWAGSKQRPLIIEAERLAEAASSQEASLRRQAEALTEERLIRLEQLATEARFDAEGVLVQDRLSVESALASYRTGTIPFVAVLEALGTLFTDRRAAVSRLAGFLRTEADLREFSLERSAAAIARSTPGTSSGAAGM
ncbi:MAG: TolC family protein [Acidobacteriota bacterium]